jgi:photosystem II stability/assembly factor-like uncharacterized protein
MKNIVQKFLILFFFSPSLLLAQGYIQNNLDSIKPNLYAIEKNFLKENTQLALTDSVKAAKQRKHFNRWAFQWRNRIDANGVMPNEQEIIKEKSRFFESQQSKIKSRTSKWHLAVPKGNFGTGRVNCLAMHPNDPNIIWAASAGGGLWRTTDSGLDWTQMTDNLQDVSAMSQVVIAPSAPNIVYATTKDHYNVDFAPARLLKTQDGGKTWQVINLQTFNILGYIARLIVHPQNPNILWLSGSNSGVFKSLDGGVSWKFLNPNYNTTDLMLNPLNPETIYVTRDNNQLWVSYNGGEDFKIKGTSPLISDARMSMSIADTNRIYFSNNKLVVSYDAGETFIKLKGNTELGNYGKYYANSLAVSPNNASDVILGGIYGLPLLISGDSAIRNDKKLLNVHPDLQFIQYVNDTIVLVATDGGVSLSLNGGKNFKDITGPMSIMQYYSMGLSPHEPDEWLAGSQDNFTHQYSKSNLSLFGGGDGMECFYDPNDSKTIFFSYQFGNIFKKSGNELKVISGNLSGTGDFITPFILHPTNSNILYMGFQNNLYRTIEDVGPSLQVLISVEDNIRNFCTSLKQPDAIYFATNFDIYKYDGKTSLTKRMKLPLLRSSIISNFKVSAIDANTIWLTLSGNSDGFKVFKSNDDGESWVNMSEGLPNLAVNCIVEQPNANGTLYLGTEVGVFRYDNSLMKWEHWSNGLPTASVTDLEIQYTANVIRAATYGRAIWEAPLEQNSSPNPVEFTELIGDNERGVNSLNWITKSESGNGTFAIERRSGNEANFELIKNVPSLGNSNKSTTYNFVDYLPKTTESYYRIRYITGYNGEKKVSNTVKLSTKNIRNINISPNPNDGLLSVRFRVRYEQECQIDITDINGKIVLSRNLVFSDSDYEKVLNINHLGSGLYVFKIKSSKDEVVETLKFVKN